MYLLKVIKLGGRARFSLKKKKKVPLTPFFTEYQEVIWIEVSVPHLEIILFPSFSLPISFPPPLIFLPSCQENRKYVLIN